MEGFLRAEKIPAHLLPDLVSSLISASTAYPVISRKLLKNCFRSRPRRPRFTGKMDGSFCWKMLLTVSTLFLFIDNFYYDAIKVFLSSGVIDGVQGHNVPLAALVGGGPLQKRGTPFFCIMHYR